MSQMAISRVVAQAGRTEGISVERKTEHSVRVTLESCMSVKNILRKMDDVVDVVVSEDETADLYVV